MSVDNGLGGHLLPIDHDSAGSSPHARHRILASNRSAKWSGSAWWPIGFAAYIVALCLSGLLFTGATLPWWYWAVLLLFMHACLLLLLLTNQVDPGVLPPSLTPDPEVLALERGEYGAALGRYSKDWRGQYARRAEDGGGWERYCASCNIWRPPRASHCNVCGYCMERYDHHCQILAVCIARRNHRFFVALLLTCQAGCLWLAGGACWRLRESGFPAHSSWEHRKTYALLLAAVVYIYHSLLLLFGVGHCFSILCDVTTKDLMTEKRQPRGSRNVRCMYRSLAELAQAWAWVCCARVRWKHHVPLAAASRAQPLAEPSVGDAELHGGGIFTPANGDGSPLATATLV